MPSAGPARADHPRYGIGKRLDAAQDAVAYRAGIDQPLIAAVAGSSNGGTDMIATSRTYKTAAVLLALVFGVFLVQGGGVNAGRVGTSQKSAEELAGHKAQECRALDGTAEVHYDMNTDGSVDSITVSCNGGGADQRTCTFYQGTVSTEVFCELMPGETEPSNHTTIGDGVLEEIEPTTTPDHGDLSGGTLDTPDSGTTRTTVRSGTFATTVQADDEERP